MGDNIKHSPRVNKFTFLYKFDREKNNLKIIKIN